MVLQQGAIWLGLVEEVFRPLEITSWHRSLAQWLVTRLGEENVQLEHKLKMANDEVAHLWRQLADNPQAGASIESEQLASLRRSFGDLSEMYGKDKVELQQLKIQMTYEQ